MNLQLPVFLLAQQNVIRIDFLRGKQSWNPGLIGFRVVGKKGARSAISVGKHEQKKDAVEVTVVSSKAELDGYGRRGRLLPGQISRVDSFEEERVT